MLLLLFFVPFHSSAGVALNHSRQPVFETNGAESILHHMLSIEQKTLALKKAWWSIFSNCYGARYFFSGSGRGWKWSETTARTPAAKIMRRLSHWFVHACLRVQSQLKCLPYRLTVRVVAAMKCNNLAIIRGVFQKDKPWQTTFLIAVASVQRTSTGKENTRCRFTFYMTELSPTLQPAHRQEDKAADREKL